MWVNGKTGLTQLSIEKGQMAAVSSALFVCLHARSVYEVYLHVCVFRVWRGLWRVW